jgi:hypothetical protein
MKFKSNVELEALSNATTDTDRFIVSDSNTLKYRTGSQVLSDIGGQALLTNPVTGTGTLNFVSKFTSTGSTLGNSLIYDNGTNVGIGTTTPGAKLDVADSIPVLRITGTRDASWTIGQTMASLEYFSEDASGSAANSVRASINLVNETSVYGSTTGLSFSTKGDVAGSPIEAMRIDSSGNVGIGTTSPTYKLDVVDGGLKTTTLSTNRIAYYNGDGVNAYGSTGWNIGNYTGDLSLTNNADDKDIIFKASAGTAAPAEIMRIDGSSGNVGIGTTSPNVPLEVKGNVRITRGLPHQTTYQQIEIGDVSTIFNGQDPDGWMSYLFNSNNTTRLVINGNTGAIQFNAYNSTNNTGTPTYILGTDASGNVVKVLGSNIPTAAPAAPGSLVATIVGETIEIAFAESSTSDIGYYQVWSSDDGGDYGLIAQITPTDFSSTMTVVDTTFATGGTMSYRVFAVKNGVYSSPGTVSKAYTVPALSVTDMTVVNLNTAYYIQYEKPTTRFIDHIEIWMDSQTTSAALLRSNAVLVYSGQNTSYMKNVNTSSNFHQFWVEVVTS